MNNSNILLQMLLGGMAPGGGELPGSPPRNPALPEVGPGRMGGPQQPPFARDAYGNPIPPRTGLGGSPSQYGPYGG